MEDDGKGTILTKGNKMKKKFNDTYVKVKNRANSEIEETKALYRLLKHAVKSYSKTNEFDLDKNDVEFIKGQSVDVIKNLLIVILTLIPVPLPLTTFLIVFGKKIGIDVKPKEHNIPDKVKKNKK
jgi:hypothetical protein